MDWVRTTKTWRRIITPHQERNDTTLAWYNLHPRNTAPYLILLMFCYKLYIAYSKGKTSMFHYKLYIAYSRATINTMIAVPVNALKQSNFNDLNAMFTNVYGM